MFTVKCIDITRIWYHGSPTKLIWEKQFETLEQAKSSCEDDFKKERRFNEQPIEWGTWSEGTEWWSGDRGDVEYRIVDEVNFPEALRRMESNFQKAIKELNNEAPSTNH